MWQDHHVFLISAWSTMDDTRKMPNFIKKTTKKQQISSTKSLHFLQEWYSSSRDVVLVMCQSPFDPHGIIYDQFTVLISNMSKIWILLPCWCPLGGFLWANPSTLLMWQMNVCNGATSCIHYIKIAAEKMNSACKFLLCFYLPCGCAC